MKTQNFFTPFLILGCAFSIISCGEGAEESAVAKQITLTTSKVALVLPNDLSFTANQTCTAGGITGPRVRLKATIKWEGEGDLLPLVIRLIFSDQRLGGDFTGAISPSDEGSESLARIFDGVTSDFIPPGPDSYTTSTCFLDYGTLPKPKVELKGTAEIEVSVIVSMTGVVRNAQGDDTPFIKEVPGKITYVAGSVPVN